MDGLACKAVAVLTCRVAALMRGNPEPPLGGVGASRNCVARRLWRLKEFCYAKSFERIASDSFTSEAARRRATTPSPCFLRCALFRLLFGERFAEILGSPAKRRDALLLLDGGFDVGNYAFSRPSPVRLASLAFRRAICGDSGRLESWG